MDESTHGQADDAAPDADDGKEQEREQGQEPEQGQGQASNATAVDPFSRDQDWAMGGGGSPMLWLREDGSSWSVPLAPPTSAGVSAGFGADGRLWVLQGLEVDPGLLVPGLMSYALYEGP